MDLFDLSKKAINKPLQPKNFFVLFTMLFIILVGGLSIISLLGLTFGTSRQFSACSGGEARNISGKVTTNQDAVYQVDSNGDSNCLLSLVLNWKPTSQSASIWVYNPDGKIEIIEPSTNQATASFLKTSPLESGRWRFVVKAKDKTTLNYSGQITLR